MVHSAFYSGRHFCVEVHSVSQNGPLSSRLEEISLGLEPIVTSRQEVPVGSDLAAQQKHAAILEKVIQFGLNQSQHLIDVQVGSNVAHTKQYSSSINNVDLIFNLLQEKMLYDKGIKLNKTEPAHFVSVFNKQKKRAKHLSKYAYATLHASSLLSKQ